MLCGRASPIIGDRVYPSPGQHRLTFLRKSVDVDIFERTNRCGLDIFPLFRLEYFFANIITIPFFRPNPRVDNLLAHIFDYFYHPFCKNI